MQASLMEDILFLPNLGCILPCFTGVDCCQYDNGLIQADFHGGTDQF